MSKYSKINKPKKPFNAKKYNVLIKLNKDPVEIQREMRDEWGDREME